MKMNMNERRALLHLAQRDNEQHSPRHPVLGRYRALRRRTYYSTLLGCWMLPDWHGMTVGIERDGHTHT